MKQTQPCYISDGTTDQKIRRSADYAEVLRYCA